MKLILEGVRREQFCDCDEIWNVQHDLSKGSYVGIKVSHYCEVHGAKLEGYMWQPSRGCECVVTKNIAGHITHDKTQCKIHCPTRRKMKLPIERSVMK